MTTIKGRLSMTDPHAFLLASTGVDYDNLGNYLDEMGAPEFVLSGCEQEDIIEVAGRACYNSFNTELNPNITKIREGKDKYLANILKTGHGSVLEHVNSTWAFTGVSRVFTHELVRHRAGAAYSQESLRFVRLTELQHWLDPSVPDNLREFIADKMDIMSEWQKELGALIDDDMPFSEKKRLTSLFRRVAPMGLKTNIIATFNLRALRHIIKMRTEQFAEAEIRFVFDQVARTAKVKWPNVFQDMERNEQGEWKFENEKV